MSLTPNERAAAIFSSFLTLADVAAAEAVGPVDAVDRSVGAVANLGEIAAEGGHAEHATAIGEEPVTVTARAGVKYLDLRVASCGVEAADFAAPLRLIGIALSRHHDASRPIGVPS